MRYPNCVVTLALVCSIMSPADAASDRPVPLHFSPAGPWTVQYEEGACILKRDFENDGKIVHFAAQQSVPGYNFNMAILAQGLKRRKTLDPKISFVPGEEAHDTDHAVKMLGPDGASGFLVSIDLSGEEPAKSDVGRTEYYVNSLKRWLLRDLDFASRATNIYLRGVFWEAISLDTGPFNVPFTEMRRCVDGLIREWGYDPDAYARLSRPPIPEGSPQYWVQAIDYPMRALEKGQQAKVFFRVDISSEGEATNCTILSLMGTEIFARAVCDALLKRAHFAPALDERGEAVPSFFASQVSWYVLP